MSARELNDAVMRWAEDLFDPDACLLWAQNRKRHMVRESAWFAFGLLRAGESERAEAMLHAVLDQQWDAPGTPWHGTFRRHPLEPDPPPAARMWWDYDPNWRQFIGSTLLLSARVADLSAGLAARIEQALRLATAGEPADRVVPAYTNIGLLRGGFEAEVGALLGDSALTERGQALAHGVLERRKRYGAFDEFNSPTYYGVNLMAAALMARHSGALAETGRELEDLLWQDLEQFFNPALGNLCGPYARAYGMDLRSHLALLGLWTGAARGLPLHPTIDGRVPHGHDLCAMPVIEVLAQPRGPLPALADARQVDLELPDGAEVSAWISRDLMLGAQRGGVGRDDEQFHSFTGHWRNGWVRVRCDARVDALVDGRDCELRVSSAPAELEFAGPVRVDGQRVYADVVQLLASAPLDLVAADRVRFQGTPGRVELRFDLAP